MQRLEHAVRARLRAVLHPGLEPCVRAVLEQRLEEAVLDLMELFQRSLDPGLGLNQVKEEQSAVGGATHSDFVFCVKTEEEELEIKPFPDLQGFRYCHRCGSTLQNHLQRPLSYPPLHTKPRCSVCGQSFRRDILLLEHNYGRGPGQMLVQTPENMTQRDRNHRSEFRCRCFICGQDFSVVSGLLEHMSEHLREPQNNHNQHEGLRNNCLNLNFSDGDEDGSESTGSSGSSSLDTFDGSESSDSAESGNSADGLEEDVEDTGDMDCAFCGRMFRDSEMLERHIHKHVP